MQSRVQCRHCETEWIETKLPGKANIDRLGSQFPRGVASSRGGRHHGCKPRSPRQQRAASETWGRSVRRRCRLTGLRSCEPEPARGFVAERAKEADHAPFEQGLAPVLPARNVPSVDGV